MNWVDEEMASVTLGDERLDTRAKQVLERMIALPTTSLPTACHGWTETQAAYRFFDNAKVTAEKVLAPHQAATRERMSEHTTVLCAQDTSELDYSKQTQTRGLGPLTYEDQRDFCSIPPWLSRQIDSVWGCLMPTCSLGICLTHRCRR